MKLQTIALITLLINKLVCTGQEAESPSVKYFATWSGYAIPKKPQKEIGEHELDQYKTYYKAYYQDKKLVKFEKYAKGKLEGYDEYLYWENSKKLKQHTVVNHLNEKRIHSYSKKGKLITDD